MGNGESIAIRGDKWLLKISAPKIISPVLVLDTDSRVCDLKDHETHTWRKELISQEFLPHEASVIVGLPLSLQDVSDT